MNFEGINTVEKAKLTKIVQAISVGEISTLYATFRNITKETQKAFCILLINNNLPGSTVALDQLMLVFDPLCAVRAAAVCLMMTRITEEGMNDV